MGAAGGVKERCAELEEQIEKVEISAGAGSENRYDEELNIAKREAADAVSRAEALEEEIEKIRRSARTTPARPVSPVKMDVNIPDDVYDFPDRMADCLLQISATQSENEARRLAVSVATKYSVTKMGDLIRELRKRLDDQTIRSLSVHFANYRSPQEVFELIKNLGWTFTFKDRQTLCDSILTWFAWNTEIPQIKEMLLLLDELGSNEPVQEMFEAIAKRRSPSDIVELTREAGSENREIMIRALATDREMNMIPNTLAEFRKAGYGDLAQRFLLETAKARPGSIDRLMVIFDAIDSRQDKNLLAAFARRLR